MKKLIFGTMFFSLVMTAPASVMARVNIGVGVSMPVISFSSPPNVIAIPYTDVYAVPGIDVDLFFWNGWWWRSWQGNWYRSHYYDRGWNYYHNVPSFYSKVDPSWRRYYRERNWHGYRWNYERIPHRQLKQNWGNWGKSRHWEKQGAWGIQDHHSQPQQQKRFKQSRHFQHQGRHDGGGHGHGGGEEGRSGGRHNR